MNFNVPLVVYLNQYWETRVFCTPGDKSRMSGRSVRTRGTPLGSYLVFTSFQNKLYVKSVKSFILIYSYHFHNFFSALL